MNAIKADILGFCFGVRRAVELAYKALDDYDNQKVYSLGPLIHNETVLQKLESKGLLIVNEDKLNLIEIGSVIIIRAHGVSPEIIRFLEEKKCIIIDATCPRVKASQKIVEKHSAQNEVVILTGDKNHGEVKGIAGYASKDFYLVQNATEAENLVKAGCISSKSKTFLLSQTTFSSAEFENISNIIKSKIPDLAVQNTICSATKERQEALIELCKKVDGVVVIGGKTSANTIRLFDIAKKNCNYAVHIQSAEELPEEIKNLKSVGITAGASTPDEIINSVEEYILKNFN